MPSSGRLLQTSESLVNEYASVERATGAVAKDVSVAASGLVRRPENRGSPSARHRMNVSVRGTWLRRG
jgi:hypothetical protein